MALANPHAVAGIKHEETTVLNATLVLSPSFASCEEICTLLSLRFFCRVIHAIAYTLFDRMKAL
jgi:hypothetical protein